MVGRGKADGRKPFPLLWMKRALVTDSESQETEECP